jgi:hypothetical protein
VVSHDPNAETDIDIILRHQFNVVPPSNPVTLRAVQRDDGVIVTERAEVFFEQGAAIS